MKKTKIILLLNSFNESEMRQFSKFIDSIFFNKREELIRMFHFLRKYYPSFEEKKIERKKVMEYVFPDEIYSEKKYKYHTNLLFKLCEKFIAMIETDNRPMIREYHLLSAYEKRNIDKNFNFILEKTERELLKNPIRDVDFHYREYLLKNVKNKQIVKKKERRFHENQQELLEAFDLYYMANKLKHSCHVLNNQGVVTGGDSDLNFTDEIIRFVGKKNYSEYPAIHLYYILYRLLTEDEHSHFKDIQELLPKYQHLFSKEELKEVNYIIINFCIQQLNRQKDTDYYLTEMYKIYKIGIKSGILKENGLLSPWTFKNVIRLGLRLGLFKEAELFIQENINSLHEKFRSDAYHFNMAELMYKQGQHNRAMSYLNKVDFSDIYYILDMKEMMIKIYYETSEYDALESLLDSFNIYLKRDKRVPENVKKSFLNFLKIMKKVINGKTEDLKEEIERTSPLTAKSWLLGSNFR